jgi:hypothetical protein
MNFRTEVKVDVSLRKISYSTPVMFIGSCFADEMAGKLEAGLMPVMCNPSGVVYNPYSVAGTLRNIISEKTFTPDDLWFHNNRWLSFSHYTDFSGEDRERVLEGLNSSAMSARSFLQNARFLFVTFGTARIFRRTDTGEVVSNCHKIPAIFFYRELLTSDAIVAEWSQLLDELKSFNPDLSVVFTVSPVRHWKDGAHGNQISKAVLLLAIEKLREHHVRPGYFPSYEIVIDDLRDYRFYKTDMLHPSNDAVEYIWEKFCNAWVDTAATDLWREVSAVKQASEHRFMNSSQKEMDDFAAGMIKRIRSLQSRNSDIDFSTLLDYFEKLTGYHN